MTRLFVTGVSGFIGGDFLAAITKTHPDFSIRALVRNVSSAEKIRKAFPTVEIVQGDLDGVDKLRSEASSADITLNLAATNHLSSFKAIHQGAAERSRAYYIQISGATVVSQAEIASKTFGQSSSLIYDDLENVQSVKDIIRQFPNRKVDNAFLDVASDHASVRSALVVAPLIYGQGKGPINQRSIQIPELCRLALERKRAVRIGEGENIWSNIHVEDLSSLLVRLVEAAVAEETEDKLWNENGLYFAEGKPGITMASLTQQLADIACEKGLLPTATVEPISANDMDELVPHGSGILGTNARINGRKARQRLNWEPKHDQIESEILRVVSSEASKRNVH